MAAPWLASGFRPFYLLGSAYAVLWAALGVAAWTGVGAPPVPTAVPMHPHEMLYGFAMAIVVGTVLTALPSWAGAPEVQGRPLAVLALAWIAGRVACAAAPWTGAVVAAVADNLLLPALAVMLAPQLMRVPNRRYRLLLPLLAWLALANLAWHVAAADGDAHGAARALRAGLWALVLLYSLKGGVLTPVFTGNALAERGRGAQPGWILPLEWAVNALLVALAFADLAGAPRPASGVLALGCLATQGWRVARWRGWRVADEPLVAALNLGFAWLLAALALKAASDLGAPVPEAAWVHAFTIGALGAMMLGLMTRVALRHTGRPLVATRVLRAALLLVSLAAALRVAETVHGLGPWALVLAVVLWAGCFGAWLLRHAGALLAPSLPAR